MESILTSIKKLLGIEEDYEQFDPDIIMHINSVFAILSQIGVGPEAGFSISNEHAVWADFFEEDPRLEFVKTYTYQKVRLMFDPPDRSAVKDALDRSVAELEWRISAYVDPGEK